MIYSEYDIYKCILRVYRGFWFAITRVVSRSIVSPFEHENKNGRDEHT